MEFPSSSEASHRNAVWVNPHPRVPCELDQLVVARRP